MGETEDKPSGGQNLLFVILGVVALFAGVFALERCHEDGVDAKGHGKLIFGHRATMSDGQSVLLLVESVLHPGGESMDTWSGRLDVIDAQTGARLARATRVDVDDCRPASQNLAWCVERPNEKDRNERALVIRDLASLAVVASADKLRESVVALGKGMATSPRGPAVDPDGGTVLFLANDGVAWRVDPSNRRATEVTGAAWDGAISFGHSNRPVQSSVTHRGKSYGFSGAGRASLMTTDGGKDRVLGSETFLAPELVVPVDHDDVLYVVHDDTLDRSVAKKQLSALGLDGKPKWRAEIGKGSLVETWRVGANLVVAVQADEGFVIAFAVADGHVVFRYDT